MSVQDKSGDRGCRCSELSEYCLRYGFQELNGVVHGLISPPLTLAAGGYRFVGGKRAIFHIVSPLTIHFCDVLTVLILAYNFGQNLRDFSLQIHIVKILVSHLLVRGCDRLTVDVNALAGEYHHCRTVDAIADARNGYVNILGLRIRKERWISH